MAHVPIQFIGDQYRSPIRNLIVSTKAYQAAEAVESIISRLTSNSPRIMVLSNGALDVRDKLISVLEKHEITNAEIVMCTTTNGAYVEPPEEDMLLLTHSGIGRTYVGGIPDVVQLWDRAGLNATSVETTAMEILLWKKLCGNCFCNPLTALWELTNGELMNHPRGPTIRKQLVKEVAEIAQASNPENAMESLSESSLDIFLEQLIQENAANRSSMYHDVKNCRPTEIDNLNGFIVRRGHDLGIDTPVNEELQGLIQGLTSR